MERAYRTTFLKINGRVIDEKRKEWLSWGQTKPYHYTGRFYIIQEQIKPSFSPVHGSKIDFDKFLFSDSLRKSFRSLHWVDQCESRELRSKKEKETSTCAPYLDNSERKLVLFTGFRRVFFYSKTYSPSVKHINKTSQWQTPERQHRLVRFKVANLF